jgi:peptidyl-prolyl cis-trans isomerase D
MKRRSSRASLRAIRRTHPMLSLFRRGFSSWLVLALLGFVAIAVVVTGVDMGGTGGSTAAPGDTLIEVEGEKITSTEVSDQVNRQLDRLRQRDPELDLTASSRRTASRRSSTS